MVIQKNILSPNSKQRSAIEHPPAPLMILAGAGTGKTFTLENRIIHLINHYNVDPQHILAITYTEKAARELKNRIVEHLGPQVYSITVSTFHSLCFKILKKYHDTLPQLLDQSEAIHMLLERFDQLGPFASDEFPLDPQRAVTESFIPFFNRARDELIDLTTMDVPTPSEEGLISPEIAKQIIDLKRIFPLFQSWKEEMNMVDYGDIILSAFKMLSSNTELLKNVQDQYRHIIVDEFQDNNFALNKIIALMAGNRKFVTVVGDDDQVIYSFRGANSFNIKTFRDSYKEHENFKSIALEKNYRSSQPILDLANASITNNAERMTKTLVSSLDLPYDKPKRFWGDKEEQIDYLISEIHYHATKGVPFKDMAVLCRTHSQANRVTDSLSNAQIPVKPKYMGLFNCSGVRDIIAWCQLVSGGTYQDSALFRLIQNECGYKTAHMIFSKCNRYDSEPRLEQLKNDNGLRSGYPMIDIMIKKIDGLRSIIQKRSAGEMVWEITQLTGILKSSAKRYGMDDHYTLLNIGNLLKRAQDFTRRNKKNHSISAFNVYLEAIMRSGGLPHIKPESYRPQDGVIVNTVHGVKGAEFPIVFVPFLRSASFPLNFRTSKRINRPPDIWLQYEQDADISPKEHHINEERRLFYVAVTRAKEKLYLLVPKKATSPFIKELSDTLMEDQTMIKPNTNPRTHSDLKTKYEQYIQKALSREAYDQVNEYGKALKIIHKHERGQPISLGDSDWENELKLYLQKDFEPPVADRINLSASAIDTYENCPLKFRLGQIDGIPQTAKKPELVFGNIIHTVLQRFHESDKELSKERILRLLDEEWKKGEFDYAVREEKFKEQGQDILERYQRLISIDPPNVLRIEEQFAFEIGPITIRGAIDRIDDTKEGLAILDYKTSKTPSSAKSSLQLAVYSMYLEQLDDKQIGGLPVSASLYFLREKEKPIRSHSFTTDQIGEAKEKIIQVAAGIRKKEFDAKTGKHCDWCDYKNLVCPAWEQ
ncbi:MAG: hypothetical protein CMG60_08710 [Candidatus Marinimicrobia bacterium]|nr:hypothetical protein [Candidatus Neomarinimicrobiota bacterium]